MGKKYQGKVAIMVRPSVGKPGPTSYYARVSAANGVGHWDGPVREDERAAERDLASWLEDRGFVHPLVHDCE